MKMTFVKGLTAFAFLLGNFTLTAALAQEAPSAIVVMPTVDTSIASGPKANVGFSSESIFRVKAGALSNRSTYRGFLTFDVGAATGSRLLEGAALNLEVDSHSYPAPRLDIYGIYGDVPDTQLSEADVTWSRITANLNSNVKPVDLTKAVNLGSLTCVADCKTLSLATGGLLKFVNARASSRISFILVARPGTSAYMHFYSKERAGAKPASLTLMEARSLTRLLPQADASVALAGSSQGENFGGNPEIVIRGGGSVARQGYLGFNLSGLKMGSSSFSNAVLEITPNKVPKAGKFDLFGITSVEGNQRFGDLQITGANAPLSNGLTKLGTFEVKRSGEKTAISSPELLKFMNEHKTFEHLTFVVRSSSEDSVERSFFSKEAGSTVVNDFTVAGPNSPIFRLLGSAPVILLENERTKIKMTGAKAHTLYYFKASASSASGNSAAESTLVPPVSADLGVLDRNGVITDGSGNATVTVQALATGLAVRAEEMPLHASIGGQDAVFQDLIDSGVVQVGTPFYKGPVQGTKVEVDNVLLETGMGADIPSIMSRISIHTQNTSDVSRRNFLKWTRWYQEDGKTQVFRLFKGEQSVRGGVLEEGKAGRIEANTSAELPSDPGLDGWLTWEGVFTPIKSGGNNFQLIHDVEGDIGWPLHIDTYEDGTMMVVHRRGREPKRELISSNVIGKNIGIRVVTNGHKYIVYRKVLGVDNDFVFVTERWAGEHKSQSRKIGFRWGVYAGSASGSVVPRDLLMLVTGVKITASAGRP